jgi:D-beta-D-heptose 7-phosphate kinase/D-beta-D-heptose 1-phosphate adenosyltransferase
MSKNHIKEAFSNNPVVLVIGDVMLDHYRFGETTRMSPEAPVPIVKINKEETKLGGAANVAMNLKQLNATVRLIGGFGADYNAGILMEMLTSQVTFGPHILADRPTTVKTRIMAQGQQMLRIDRESCIKIQGEDERKIIHGINHFWEDYAFEKPIGIFVSDYNKGFITKNIVKTLKSKECVCIADPKPDNIDYYKGFNVITPNRGETEQITGIKLTDEESIAYAGKTMQKDYDIETVLITLGEDGMAVFDKGNDPIFVKPVTYINKQVVDVTGAGDAVVAIFGLGIINGLDPEDAALCAVKGAEYVVGQIGTARVFTEIFMK